MDDRDAEMPVSVKGVLAWGREVVLLRNDRGEWELPGGRPDAGETPEEALARELHEELGVVASVGAAVGAERFAVIPGREVLVLSYRASAPRSARFRLSDEHVEVGVFDVGALDRLPLPAVYRRAIRRAVDGPR